MSSLVYYFYLILIAVASSVFSIRENNSEKNWSIFYYCYKFE